MDKKLTDKEIVKALKELLKELKGKKQLIVPEQGVKNLCYGLKNFLDLINRLQAENEYLNKEVDRLSQVVLYNEGVTEMKVEEAKSEAYKEFADRLKEEVTGCYGLSMCYEIDNLLKEMGCE